MTSEWGLDQVDGGGRRIGSWPLGFAVGYGLLAALVLVFCLLGGGKLRYGDEQQYLELATSLAQGHGFRLDGIPTAYRPPVWPLLLTPAAALPGGSALVAVVPVLCLIVAGVLAARTGRQLVGHAGGLLAGPAVLLYPLDVYTARTLYPQSLALLVVVALVGLAVEFEAAPVRRLSAGRSVAVGLLAAAVALAVPTMIFTAGLFLAWFLLRHQAGRWRYFLVAGTAFGLPVLAWALRNLAVLGAAVPFSTTSGINLLLGNSPKSTATTGVAADLSAYSPGAQGLSEVDRNAYYTSMALQWIGDHPGAAARLYAAKVANYFSAYNEPVTAGQGGRGPMLIAWVSLVLLVTLVVVRFLPVVTRSVRPRAVEVFLLVVFVANAPFMAIFFTRTRFRQPLDAILIIEAAITVAVLGAAVARRRWPAPATRQLRPERVRSTG